MFTAYNLGRLTVKMAESPYQPYTPTKSVTAPFSSPVFEPIIGKPPPTQSNVKVPTASWFSQRAAAPSFSKPVQNNIPYVGNETTAKKFVPSPAWPDIAKQRDSSMLARYYSDFKPGNSISLNNLAARPELTLGGREQVYTPASQLYHEELPIANLALNKNIPTTVPQLATQAITRPAGIIGGLAQAKARNIYENRLRDLRNIAFKERTTVPFYYNESNQPLEESNVGFSGVVPNRSNSRAASMTLGRYNPASSLLPPAMNRDAVALHEHAHTTQADSTAELPRSAFEIPATLSEIGHAADAYQAATGQWPKGTYLGMPIQEISEDLKRRRHIGGPVTINEIMQSPEYLNRIKQEAQRIDREKAMQQHLENMRRWSSKDYDLDYPQKQESLDFKLPPYMLKR